jgi:hypothetical protein
MELPLPKAEGSTYCPVIAKHTNKWTFTDCLFRLFLFHIRCDSENCRTKSNSFPRRQRTEVGKFSFVNMTITDWNQLSEGKIEALTGNAHSFRIRVTKVITSAAKWWWQKWNEGKGGVGEKIKITYRREGLSE